MLQPLAPPHPFPSSHPRRRGAVPRSDFRHRSRRHAPSRKQPPRPPVRQTHHPETKQRLESANGITWGSMGVNGNTLHDRHSTPRPGEEFCGTVLYDPLSLTKPYPSRASIPHARLPNLLYCGMKTTCIGHSERVHDPAGKVSWSSTGGAHHEHCNTCQTGHCHRHPRRLCLRLVCLYDPLQGREIQRDLRERLQVDTGERHPADQPCRRRQYLRQTRQRHHRQFGCRRLRPHQRRKEVCSSHSQGKLKSGKPCSGGVFLSGSRDCSLASMAGKAEKDKNASRPISRVLYGLRALRRGNVAAIHLGRLLPDASRNLPGRWAGNSPRGFPRTIPIRFCSRWGLPCRFRCRSRGGLLPHPFTLTAHEARRFAFCGTFPGVAPAGRYPAPCPMELGLSSPNLS